MLDKLFGNAVIEKILFYLLMNEECYGAQLSRDFGIALYSIQRALMRLEEGGIIAAKQEGKTRVYQFNPRYPFLSELKIFLTKAYGFFPREHQLRYYEPSIRRRPRRTGKPL